MKINLSDYTQFWKNHKPLQDVVDEAGNQIFQITKWNERIRYIEQDGEKQIVDTFVKPNHLTTEQARKKK